MNCIGSRYILELGISRLDIKEKRDSMAKPLTQPMYYILLSLRDERHGYEIMQYVDWLTDGRVAIGPGTLYSLLSRFEDDKYIEMVSKKDNKKTYKLTKAGQEVLNKEIKRLEYLLSDAKKGDHEDEFQNRDELS